METEGRSNGALWRQNLSCASQTIRRICKAADRRIVQAHGTTDLRETIAVVEMSSANGFIPPYPVGPSPGASRSINRSLPSSTWPRTSSYGEPWPIPSATNAWYFR